MAADQVGPDRCQPRLGVLLGVEREGCGPGLAGLVLMLVVLGRAATGAYSGREHAAVEVATYYWHFVDIVWIGLFTTIFVVR